MENIQIAESFWFTVLSITPLTYCFCTFAPQFNFKIWLVDFIMWLVQLIQIALQQSDQNLKAFDQKSDVLSLQIYSLISTPKVWWHSCPVVKEYTKIQETVQLQVNISTCWRDNLYTLHTQSVQHSVMPSHFFTTLHWFVFLQHSFKIMISYINTSTQIMH